MSVWGRGLGFSCMALVDTADLLSNDKSRQARLLDRLNELVPALLGVVDSNTGAWWQVLDKPGHQCLISFDLCIYSSLSICILSRTCTWHEQYTPANLKDWRHFWLLDEAAAIYSTIAALLDPCLLSETFDVFMFVSK